MINLALKTFGVFLVSIIFLIVVISVISRPISYFSLTQTDELINNDLFAFTSSNLEAGLCTTSTKPFQFLYRSQPSNEVEIISLEATESSVEIGSCNAHYFKIHTTEMPAGLWQIYSPDGVVKLSTNVTLVSAETDTKVENYYVLISTILIAVFGIAAFISFVIIFFILLGKHT